MIGLLLSAGLLASVGGRAGIALAVLQLAAAAAIVVRPGQPAPLAAAAFMLVVAPVSAIVHWTAESPLGCRCQRVAHAPGLVSRTGLVVVADLVLLGLALWAGPGIAKKRWETPPVSEHQPGRGKGAP